MCCAPWTRSAGSSNVAGYVDPRPVGLPILAERDIAPGKAYASVAALLKDGPFDLVMIGSPNHLHYEHLLAAFAAGYPIFAEKPIVRTEEETFALARHLAAKKTPPLYIGLVMRSMPIVRETIKRVDSGALGELVSMDATEHLPPEHGGYLARNWRRKQEWGGSYYLDKVCHDFDIFGRLRGRGPPASPASAASASFDSNRKDVARTYSDGPPAYAMRDAGWAGANDAFHSDMDVADHQTAIVEYDSGLQPVVPFQQPCQPGRAALVHRGHRRHAAGGSGAQQADDPPRHGQGQARAHRLSPTAPPTTTTAPTRRWRRICWRRCEGRAAFPVTPYESMEAGLTVMAIDRAMTERAPGRLRADVGGLRRGAWCKRIATFFLRLRAQATRE